MKFTVEVEDFWLDEEELTASLQSHIKREVVHEIAESIKTKVEKQVTDKVNEVINEKIALVIDSTLTDLIADGMIVRNRETISIVDHVKSVFQSNTGWSNPTRQLEALAKKFGEEMKAQYNAAFANKIISNMKEQGLLKDDVVKILLEGK